MVRGVPARQADSKRLRASSSRRTVSPRVHSTADADGVSSGCAASPRLGKPALTDGAFLTSTAFVAGSGAVTTLLQLGQRTWLPASPSSTASPLPHWPQ